MGFNVNCIHNDGGAWCKCQLIKRSLFGFGARMCVEYPPRQEACIHRVGFPRPAPPRSQVVKERAL